MAGGVEYLRGPRFGRALHDEKGWPMPRAKGPKQPIVISAPEVITRERAIYLDRLAGKSIRVIAEEFGISTTEAQAIISAQCTVDTQLKLHTVELELARLDDLSATFYPRALKGDTAAAALLLRIQERRSALRGTDTPLRIDAVQVRAEAVPQSSSIDCIMAALQRVAGKPEPNDSDLPEDPGGGKPH
jgi:hypothetical protein